MILPKKYCKFEAENFFLTNFSWPQFPGKIQNYTRNKFFSQYVGQDNYGNKIPLKICSMGFSNYFFICNVPFVKSYFSQFLFAI